MKVNYIEMSEVVSLYAKLFDTLLVVRDVRERFHAYSARDINALIASKLKSKTSREPEALKHLYTLEAMISDLRVSLQNAKADILAGAVERGGE